MEAEQFTLSNLPSVLETILANQIANAKAAEEAQTKAAKAQARQAEAQARFEAKLAEVEATLVKQHDTVVRKLETIESNTVTIMGMMIQDFNNVFADTKQEIETFGDDIAQHPDTIDFIDAALSDTLIQRRNQPNSKFAKATPSRYFGSDNLTTVKDAVANLDMEDYKISLIPLGNYVSSIITKIWNYNFGGKYSVYFAPLIEALVKYHTTERNSPRNY